MENASKALLIAGAILLAILIIAIGMFIYNSAQATVNDSMTSLSTQEIDAFNNQFVSYEQKQTGSNVKALIGRLIANAKTYTEEAAKVPKVTYTASTDSNANVDKKGKALSINQLGSNDGDINAYVNGLSLLRNAVENKHPYWVEFTYGSSGLIELVTITYDLPN